jgi:hypothetical protein
MIKYLSLAIYLSFSLFASDDIGGFWKSLNDDGEPQCIFGVYEHEGIYYGRIIGTYNDEGVLADTIYKPISRAEGISGNPHTCGLDIVYGLQSDGWRYVGKIIDPSKGKTYNCEMWREGKDLILRGKLFIFGKNIKWYATTKADFPKNFKLPDMAKFTPDVPEVN